MIVLKLLLFYMAVAAAETLNGIARTLWLNRRFGTGRAKRISLAVALLLCLLLGLFFLPWIGEWTAGQLLFVGLGLAGFMLLFDLLLGRYVLKYRWEVIMNDFNMAKGNYLAIGLLMMIFCPLISSRLAAWLGG